MSYEHTRNHCRLKSARQLVRCTQVVRVLRRIRITVLFVDVLDSNRRSKVSFWVIFQDIPKLLSQELRPPPVEVESSHSYTLRAVNVKLLAGL